MTKSSLEHVIEKTMPTKPDLKYLLTKYKTNSTSLNHYEQIELSNQLTGVLTNPAIRMLKGGWRSPHGSIIYTRGTCFEVEDIINEGIVYTLDKIDQYNTEFSATNFVYLKLEEVFRTNILPRQATPVRMSKRDYEEMENYDRQVLSNPQSVEVLLSEKVDGDELKLSSTDVESLHKTSSQSTQEVVKYENITNKLLLNLNNTIMESKNLSSLEKQVYYLSSGFFGQEIQNSEIEEFTNGEITSEQYIKSKNTSRYKIKRIYENLASTYEIKSNNIKKNQETQKPKKKIKNQQQKK